MGSVAGGRLRLPPELAIGGVRPAQQDLYELISQAKPAFYSSDMWQRLGDHSPYDDLDITNDRITRWHPLNQSLYVGYKVMLAGLLMISKGDRIAMNASVETRYPFLDDDVIAFCAGIAPEYKLRGLTEKWILRQVAARILPARIANRPKTMFRACMSGTFLGPRPAGLGRPVAEPRVAPGDGLFRPGGRGTPARLADPDPADHARAVHLRRGLTCVVSTQLWHHIFCGGGLCDLPTWQPATRPPNPAGSALSTVA